MIVQQIGGVSQKSVVETLDLEPDRSPLNKIQQFIYEHIGGPAATIKRMWLVPRIPDNLKVETNELFGFQVGADALGQRMTNVAVPKGGREINIVVNTEAITDLEETPRVAGANVTVDVGLAVKWKDSKNQRHTALESTVPITIIPAPTDKYEAEIVGRSDARVEHGRGKRPTLFKVKLCNPTEFIFSNPVSGRLDVMIVGESAIPKDAFIFVHIDGTESPAVTLLSREEKVVRIDVDLNKVENLCEQQRISATIETMLHDGTPLSSLPVTIILDPDSQTTKLGIGRKVYHACKVDENEDRELHEFKYTATTPIHYVMGQSGQERLFELVLRNLAEAPNPPGEVVIRDFTYKFSITDSSGTHECNSLLEVESSEVSDRVSLPNGQIDRHLYFHAVLIPTDLLRYFRLDDKVSCELVVEFACDAVQEARNIDEHKRVRIVWTNKILRRVNKWLSVDFGTSAIAACLFDDATGRITRLNLSNIHSELTKRKRGRAEVGFPDMKTGFLCSTMYLDLEVKGEPYDLEGKKVLPLTEDIIEFAPGSETVRSDGFNLKVLPDLKTLVGYDRVPFLKPNWMFEISGKPEIQKELPVTTVLRTAYRKLFRDYIIPALKKEFFDVYGGTLAERELLSVLGNVVVAVPNTFNQTHEALIRNVLMTEITWETMKNAIRQPSSDAERQQETGTGDSGDGNRFSALAERTGSLFFKDGVKFISESDAVLIYYLTNYRRLTGDHNPPREERILVYDIGAGTLDMTYARVERTDGGSYQVHELGKLGIGSAGNAIDTMLAKYLCVELQLLEEEDTGKSDLVDRVFGHEGTDGFVFANVAELKSAIRGRVKIDLNQDGSLELGTVRRSRLFDDKDRRKHLRLIEDAERFRTAPTLQALFKRIVGNAIGKLSKIVDPENIDRSSGREKLCVDRVVVSGRASLFRPLERKLIKALLDNTTVTADSICRVSEDDLKVAVALGALSRYSRANVIEFFPREVNAFVGVLCSYGVGDDTVEFRRALSPGEKPFEPNDRIEKSPFTLNYCVGLGKLDCSRTSRLTLLKSYVESPEDDYRQGRTEMTSAVAEITSASLRALSGAKVDLSVLYDDFLRFRMEAGPQSTTLATLEISLHEDLSFEENTWPFNRMVELNKDVRRLIEKTRAVRVLKPESTPETVEEIDAVPTQLRGTLEEPTDEESFEASDRDASPDSSTKDVPPEPSMAVSADHKEAQAETVDAGEDTDANDASDETPMEPYDRILDSKELAMRQSPDDVEIPSQRSRKRRNRAKKKKKKWSGPNF